MGLSQTETVPQTYRFTVDFADLGLTTDDIARGMGYTDGVQSTYFGDDLDALMAEAADHACIEGGFRVFSPESVFFEREGFRVEEHYFETGRIIADPLRSAATLAFFVVTAGAGFSAWSSKLMRERDHVQAYFVDALGSEAVEKAADWVEARIIDWSAERGRGTTNRYSPGYCGWSVAEQHNLFSLLPPDFCGVKLTESALMQPEKSVSGIVGIGGSVERLDYGCKICTLEHCFRRRL
jgi:hypothetical protein